jgi:acetoin utilization deacetylase AcuC-like enzyme
MLNDQAIAAQFLLDNKLANKILIIDLDVHQGNGTAEKITPMFYIFNPRKTIIRFKRTI